MLDIFIINKGFGEFGGSKLGVIVMFPTKGISKVQRQQMVSCTAHNVKVAMLPVVMLLLAMLPLVMLSAKMSHPPSPQVVAVEGDFDDCQRLVKSMFAEEEMKAFLGYFLSLILLFVR